jgi:hypothetical protein
VSDQPPPAASSRGALQGAAGYSASMAALSIATQALGLRLWRSHPIGVALIVVALCSALRLGGYAILAEGYGGMAHGLCNYDCAWYERTAQYGYDLGPRGDLAGNTANWAFFPLFPILLGIVTALTGSGEVISWAGILLSTALFAGFAVTGALYLQQTGSFGTPEASSAHGLPRLRFLLLWIGFVSLWPGALYFAFPYSEALYALVMTAALLALTRRKIVSSALWCALLGATRPTGMLMVPLILIDRLAYLRRAWSNGEARPSRVEVLGNVILPLALAPFGLILFMAYLRWHMGDGLAFIHVQSAWHRHSEAPWTLLWEGLAADDWGRIFKHPAEESLSVQAAFGVAGLLLAFRQICIGRYAEAWLIGASILLAASSGLQSIPRFVLTNPIVMLVLFRMAITSATLRGNALSPRRLWMVGAGLGMAQIALAVAWFIGAPVFA